ncbi:unnamed protein product [Cutaneotrichosporon oleaginosum]
MMCSRPELDPLHFPNSPHFPYSGILEHATFPTWPPSLANEARTLRTLVDLVAASAYVSPKREAPQLTRHAQTQSGCHPTPPSRSADRRASRNALLSTPPSTTPPRPTP